MLLSRIIAYNIPKKSFQSFKYLSTEALDIINTEDIIEFKQPSSEYSSEQINTETKPISQPDIFGRYYGTGKRKTSIARVWIKDGAGE